MSIVTGRIFFFPPEDRKKNILPFLFCADRNYAIIYAGWKKSSFWEYNTKEGCVVKFMSVWGIHY